MHIKTNATQIDAQDNNYQYTNTYIHTYIHHKLKHIDASQRPNGRHISAVQRRMYESGLNGQLLERGLD